MKNKHFIYQIVLVFLVLYFQLRDDIIRFETCLKLQVVYLFITIEQKEIYKEMRAYKRLILIRLAKYIVCNRTFKEKRRKNDHVLKPQGYDIGKLCLSF